MYGWNCRPGWTAVAGGSGGAVLARLRVPRPGDTGVRMLTVGDWLAHWLVTKTATAASTVRGYAAHVRLYLGPYLGRCCWPS